MLNGHALVNDSLVQEDDMGKLVAIVYFNREELERKYQTRSLLYDTVGKQHKRFACER